MYVEMVLVAEFTEEEEEEEEEEEIISVYGLENGRV